MDVESYISVRELNILLCYKVRFFLLLQEEFILLHNEDDVGMKFFEDYVCLAIWPNLKSRPATIHCPTLKSLPKRNRSWISLKISHVPEVHIH